ncbi:type IV secretory system conjugative DNA transfer family protein [Francisella philomiragia]|uniref:type IV secretory system conjugative DNA transfer family protein n=1 Tax=Francisella philomiragia TaxID=28110 RepID=UPI001906FB38|nr:type IV secretory system conjugative DNA transfer family protein [Francisella philomiragia]MBK2257571.1 type IV secretory system conjugative DNA transfer family protein [Francisella philomiragia]MBK2270267.1 type IV secretory system conjugative DNA transfer family protein [Francisella philomiragia]MBK2272113.1 type IV secretory system conjugative DNA transfer family protein [Francisella philomiragia]MBK2275952.1 type IV secretory system conjugative DNA transfer family protein [Francisella ph
MNIFSVLELDSNKHTNSQKMIILGSSIANFIAYIFVSCFWMLFNYLFYFSGKTSMYIGLDSSWLYNFPVLYMVLISCLYHQLLKNKYDDQTRLVIVALGLGQALASLAYVLILLLYLQSHYANAFVGLNLIAEANMTSIIVFIINAVIGTAMAAFLSSDKSKEKMTKFGAAKLGTVEDFKKKDMILPNKELEITSDNQNYTVGKFKGTYIVVKEILNSITYAKPQSDKGVSDIMPFMFECPEPIVSTDFKAEIIQTVSPHRAIVFNKKPVLIDPYNDTLKYDAKKWGKQQILSFNPLDIGLDIDLARYTTIIANAICEPIPTGPNASFYKGARKIVEGILITILFYKGYLTELFDMLTNSEVSKMVAFLENSAAYDSIYGEKVRSAISTLKKCANEKDELNRYGEAALEIALNSCDFMADPNMYYFFKRKDDVPAERVFNVVEYLNGNADIYLVIPDDLIEFSKKFIALFIGVLSASFSFGKDQKKRKRYPFVIDELAQLGYMKCLEQLYEIGQSKGVRLKLYFQNISQLHDYKKAPLFKGFDIRKFFGINDPDTAKEIQAMAGDQTIENESIGERKAGKLDKKDESRNTSLMGTKLLTIDKILQLPENQQILFLPNDTPLTICEKVQYYTDPRFKDCASENLAIEVYEHLIPSDNKEVQEQILRERGLFVDMN